MPGFQVRYFFGNHIKGHQTEYLMKPSNDLSDMLVEEVMYDMAETFFGSRVEIDEMLELFEEFVEELKQKSEGVSLRAGLLNKLLIDSNTITKFYSHLNIDPENLLKKSTYSEKVLPAKMPISITVKSEFTKLFLFAYESLQKACGDYVHGSLPEDDDEKQSVNYALLVNMSRVINEKIKKVNERSTVCTLQYARQFKTETIEKEQVVGTGFLENGCDGIDRNMKFKPLKFDSYKIEKYPELPKTETVKSTITAFAKKVFSDNTVAAKKVLSDIRGKVRARKNDEL
jgi:hypothetical protein